MVNSHVNPARNQILPYDQIWRPIRARGNPARTCRDWDRRPTWRANPGLLVHRLDLAFVLVLNLRGLLRGARLRLRVVLREVVRLAGTPSRASRAPHLEL